MIAPRGRLIWLIGLTVLPLSAVPALTGGTIWLALAAGALVALLAVADAAASLPALRDVDVEMPDLARLTKDVRGEISLRVLNPSKAGRSLRAAISLSTDFDLEDDEKDVRLPEGAEAARLRWEAIPRRRGRWPMQECYLETPSRLGLWAIRKKATFTGEIRVYPNLLVERKNMAGMFLNRGDFGMHLVRQVGQGREFEKLREYIPGDSYEDIHWKATAKRGMPATKIYQVERTQEVYVIMDGSRLSSRASAESREDLEGNPLPGESVLERYVTAGLMLGIAAERQGDLFGLMTFSDKVDTFVRAGAGRAHFRSCRDALYTVQPRTVAPDFEEVCSFIRLRLRKRALLLFLTALDDPVVAESFSEAVRLISRQHLVLVGVVGGPEVAPILGRGPEVQTPDDIYHRLAGHFRWSRLRELEKEFKHRGVDLTQMDDERLSAQLVTQYMNVKRRQRI